MPGIDQILSFIIQQGADELRLGTDEEPLTFSKGVRRHFTMSKTPDAVLRQLLGEILSPERQAQLANRHRLCFDYPSQNAGTFQVTLEARSTGGMDVTFAQATSGSYASTNTSTRSSPTNLKPHEVDQGAAKSDVTSAGTTAALRTIVEEAYRLRASDIHLVDGEVPYLRIDGRLAPFNRGTAVKVAEFLNLDAEVLQKISNGLSVDFALDLERQLRLRVTVYKNQSGTAAAIRLLPSEAPSLADLQLPTTISDLAELPNGLVLFCGATGSGKSSTLAALSRHALEHRSALLVTLEIESSSACHPRHTRSFGSDKLAATWRTFLPVCAMHCAVTPTSSLSANCATQKPSACH